MQGKVRRPAAGSGPVRIVDFDFEFAGEHAVTVLGERIQFVFSGIDFYRSDKRHPEARCMRFLR